ncbi:hypothetical protein DL762_003306 [Monosporascus cannonballus]|uniref:F-box domain-containing protein n=1 Tax=Monosporascus cannonballus TaxID=155416 RepID=A0ABY0HBJ4_9PEZI|nr:hypothetical protein DL762_003306 [Monosporascus cannonballus]RYP00750.1 hypothetical protein DL763_000630 [Monosporascus cannonballus]
MASILSLPVELLVFIAQELEDVQDIAALSRSCRRIYNTTIFTLYRYVKDDPAVMCWAVDEGHVQPVKYLLAAGADPNVAWVQSETRSRTLERLYYEGFSSRLMRSLKAAVDDDVASNNEEAKGLTFKSHTDEKGGLEDDGDAEYDDDGIFNDGYDSADYDDDESDDDPDDISDTYESESESESDNDSDNEDISDGNLTFTRQYFWTPLHIAARWGHDELAELLLNHGANIQALSRGLCECFYPTDRLPKPKYRRKAVFPLWMPLHTAICHGHDSTARLLLARGASTAVATRGRGAKLDRATALHSACYSGLTSLSRFLIEGGYQNDVEARDHRGMTPMSYAYYSGNWESIDLLVEHGATLNARLGPASLFKHACWYSRFSEALRFIELGADVDVTYNEVESSPLHCCCMQPYSVSRGFVRLPKRVSDQASRRDDVVQILLDSGQHIEVRNYDLETPLIQAARYHLASTIEVLLAAGASTTVVDDAGHTALTSACASEVKSSRGELLRIVKALLPGTQAKDCAKALYGICATTNRVEDKAEVVRLLLANGASLSLQYEPGQNILSRAIAHGNLELADLLLDSGLKQPDSKQLSDLIDAAIEQDNASALRYLIDTFQGAEDAMKDGRRLYNALLHRGGKCAKFLIKAGAPVTYRGDDDTTCLIRATAFTRTSLAKMLLERGADPNELSYRDRSPLSFPVVKGNQRMIKLLLDHGADIHKRTGGPEGNSIVDLAVHGGHLDALAIIVHHRAWWNSTKAQRNDYVIRALLSAAGTNTFELGATLNYLLQGGADPNAVYEALDATPLHLSILFGQGEAVRVLMRHGADVHRKLAIRHSLPFENMTPLEYAISSRSASLGLIKDMLERSPLRNINWDSSSDTGSDCDSDSDSDAVKRDPAAISRTEPLDIMALAVDYTRAACRRHKPEVFSLLFGRRAGGRPGRLDPNLRDGTGNTPLALLCAAVESGLADSDFTADMVAMRTALCVAELLRLGADPVLANHAGVTPLQRVARLMDYEGPGEYLAAVAREWSASFVIKDSVLRARRGGE